MKSEGWKFLMTLLVCSIAISCKKAPEAPGSLDLNDVFKNPPITIQSVTQSYISYITAEAINDMDETVLCMSTKINDKSNTYFIQPDKVEIKELSYRYESADIVDMKTALLFNDKASGKKTLIYLPGRFPIDSMDIKPDVMIPVLGISRYQSDLEKITSRWTQIVCKCTDVAHAAEIYKGRTIEDCDTGGTGTTECALSVKGSITNCQTDCREGAIACCWFEF